MPWISRTNLDILHRSLEAHVAEGVSREARAQQDRIDVQTARAQYASLAQGQAALHERVTAAEKSAAVSEATASLYRLQLNEVKLERATLLSRMLAVDVQVAQVERPLAMAPEGGGGVSFEDLGDAAAAAEGYKDMHDIPASKPAFPSVTES